MLDNPNGLSAQLDILRGISRALAKPLDELGVLRAMHAELSRALDMTMCFFGRFDVASQSVEVIWQMHQGAELPGGQFPLGSGPTSEAIRTCRPRLISNWSTQGPAVQVQYATDRPHLPQSSVVVPVVYAEQVAGVLSVQSYAPAAYDEDDVRLLEAVADMLAMTLFRSPAGAASDSDAVLASMDDALVVLDADSRIVRLNGAARRLLCNGSSSVVLGQPVDCPQAEQWPLGSKELTHQVSSLLERLQESATPLEEAPLTAGEATIRCRASVLRNADKPAGTVLVLR